MFSSMAGEGEVWFLEIAERHPSRSGAAKSDFGSSTSLRTSKDPTVPVRYSSTRSSLQRGMGARIPAKSLLPVRPILLCGPATIRRAIQPQQRTRSKMPLRRLSYVAMCRTSCLRLWVQHSSLQACFSTSPASSKETQKVQKTPEGGPQMGSFHQIASQGEVRNTASAL